MSLTTWRTEIDAVLAGIDEPIRACTLTEEELDVEFDYGYGVPEGQPFTAWTENWVLFPVCYDGAEWCDKARRDPCDVANRHVGGG